MDLSKHLLHLENRLLSRAVREDAAELARLIADDFVESAPAAASGTNLMCWKPAAASCTT
jgi:hypothetical protein